MIKTSLKRAQQHQLFIDLGAEDSENSPFIQLSSRLEKKLVINARDNRDEYGGLTLLHEAARLGKICAVKHLIILGHEVDCIDSSVSGVTPLMEAVTSNHIDIAILLLKSGANIAFQDCKGENAIHYGARVGTRIIAALLSHSEMSKDELQGIVCSRNVKLQFPEDIALTPTIREYIVYIRIHGQLPPKRSRSKRQ
jgi:ankyrin repeat protein